MEGESEIKLVQLDGLVVLKILKHCKENLPDFVTGQLLGWDVGSTLEIANSFPYPKIIEPTEEETEVVQVGAEYQFDMMRCLRDVDMEYTSVGWYTSAYMSTFFDEATINTQYSYQEGIKQSIMLIYDPIKTSQGILSLRAFRLTKAFMELLREERSKSNQFTKESLAKAKVSHNDIFEELPIKIRNSEIVDAFLTEMQEKRVVDTEFDKLNLSTNPYLERNLEALGECLDELAQEQNKFQYYQRNLQRTLAQRQAWLVKRRAENAQRKMNGEEPLPEEDPYNPIFKPIQEPKRLDALLWTKQINAYCKEMNHYAGNSFAKLFLATSLNGSGNQ